MFKTTIGLEIHVQLKTKSKMFCGCDNKADEAAPNTLVCPVCSGLPGVLPVANFQAIEWTLKTGLALNCQLAEFSRFDRKHYFYPDLPKNYQISQYDMPFCEGGFLEVDMPEGLKKINLTRIHLEEDAGKLIHAQDASLVDLNRAGTPLMEIVTEPEINSPEEAKIFIQELRSILRYLDVSDANMEKGHLRCDANISIMQNDDSHPERSEGSPANAGTGTSPEILRSAQNDKLQMGTPVEIKNLNSFRMVERALLYEEKRQKELLEKGEKVVKETRGWNDEKGETYSQRSKEFAQDYRYFPEPDLPPFEKENFDLEKIKSEIPELPSEKRKRYVQEFGIPAQDAVILTQDKSMAGYFEKVVLKIKPKIAANWVINELKIGGILKVSSDELIELLEMLEKDQISGKIAKEVLAEMILNGQNAPEIVGKKGLKQIGEESEIMPVIEKVIAQNSEVVKAVKAGKTQAISFLVGKIMQETKGQANPQMVNEILKEKIAHPSLNLFEK